MTQHITLLVNPTAGGRPAVTATRLLRHLREGGADGTVVAGRSPQDGARLAREATATGTGASPAVGYADGERIAETPVTCEVVPGSVRMLTAAALSRTS